MAEVEISYKGNKIAEMSDSGVKTLKTEGTYCEDDIRVKYEARHPTVIGTTIDFGSTASVDNGELNL